VFVGVKVAVGDAVAVGVVVLDKVGLLVTVGVPVFVLVGIGVWEAVALGVGVGVDGWGMIWMASTMALSTLAGPNWMVMAPPEGAMLLNASSTAMSDPPAVLKISKLVRTVLPLMETLKTLSPAAVQ
jgi:hypothetical protein